jgi:hypothetical protein
MTDTRRSEYHPSLYHSTVLTYRPYSLHTLSTRGVRGNVERDERLSLVVIAPGRAMDVPTPPSLLQPAIDANLHCVRLAMAS